MADMYMEQQQPEACLQLIMEPFRAVATIAFHLSVLLFRHAQLRPPMAQLTMELVAPQTMLMRPVHTSLATQALARTASTPMAHAVMTDGGP